MTVELGVANNRISKCIIKEWLKTLRGVPILFSLLNFGMFACSISLSQFSHFYLEKAALNSLDIILTFLINLKSRWFFSTAARLHTLSWNFSYSLTELQTYSLCESFIKSFEAKQ